MASIRQFKKDIDFVTSELMIECFTYNLVFPEKNQLALAEIISASIQMRSDLLDKVNAVKSTPDNPAKKQFVGIRKEFTESIQAIVLRLDGLDKFAADAK